MAVLVRLGLDCSRFGSCFFARKDFPCGVRNRMQDKILFRQLRFSLFFRQPVTLTYVSAGFCQKLLPLIHGLLF